MATPRAYLDWNATAPLLPQARAAMIAALDLAGNPSSVHHEGRRARACVETAREQVAAMLGARPADVVFTSGATEANNAVLAAGWDVVASSALEHDSVRAPAARHAGKLIDLPLRPDGRLDIEATLPLLSATGHGPRRLLCLQLANNETGVIQPVAELVPIARSLGWSVLCDAVQGAGRAAIDIGSLDVDYLTISAHKIGGPKGAGALFARDTARAPSAASGGGQERRRRAGTENIAAIAGFGAAANIARGTCADTAGVRRMRDRIEALVLAITPTARIVGAETARIPNTTCLALPGLSSELAVVKLDLAGVAVSAGAACSSGKVGASGVLLAMGLAPELARAAFRLSIGPATRDAEIEFFLAAWRSIAGADVIAA